jgi:hypothetical protein
LAVVDGFNFLQPTIVLIMYIYSLTYRWWKDFQLGTDQRFTRDRMVELHFWMMGAVYEPCYSYSRIMLTKFTVYATMFDDLYDNHGTTVESNIFTAAMERFA